MAKSTEILWQPEPEEHDYPAAESYLALIFDGAAAQTLVKNLRRAEVAHFKAKDIFRASGLSLLGVSNSHVEKDRRKILKGAALSPLLLVRDKANGKVIVADGYHRLCAVYSFFEDALIPCKIA
jgi:disulfide oxidoreductase YuzD